MWIELLPNVADNTQQTAVQLEDASRTVTCCVESNGVIYFLESLYNRPSPKFACVQTLLKPIGCTPQFCKQLKHLKTHCYKNCVRSFEVLLWFYVLFTEKNKSYSYSCQALVCYFCCPGLKLEGIIKTHVYDIPSQKHLCRDAARFWKYNGCPTFSFLPPNVCFNRWHAETQM